MCNCLLYFTLLYSIQWNPGKVVTSLVENNGNLNKYTNVSKEQGEKLKSLRTPPQLQSMGVLGYFVAEGTGLQK